jgi:hypothetical protein
MHEKGPSVGLPRDNVSHSNQIHLLQHFKETLRKMDRNATTKNGPALLPTLRRIINVGRIRALLYGLKVQWIAIVVMIVMQNGHTARGVTWSRGSLAVCLL